MKVVGHGGSCCGGGPGGGGGGGVGSGACLFSCENALGIVDIGGGGGGGGLFIVPLKVCGEVDETGVLAVDGLDLGKVAKDGGGGGGGGGRGPLFETGVDNGEGVVACTTGGLRPGVDAMGDGIGPL